MVPTRPGGHGGSGRWHNGRRSDSIGTMDHAVIRRQMLDRRRAHTPEAVARQTLGQDLESPEFWSEAIMSLEESLDHLEQLLPEVLPPTGRD